MPGITGIIRKYPCEGMEQDLGAMIDVMRHEKFYRSGQYVNKELGLYIGWMNLKASFTDCMPLVNNRRDVILIFHGENYLEDGTFACLRQSGNGVDDSNAQCLLKLYEATGDDFVRRLNGWFCGVLIDLRARKITIFNDRYGMS